MATWLPVPQAIPQFCGQYVHHALGFAVGWNNWSFCAIVLCLEIDAAPVIIGYWEGAIGINPAAWISVLIVLVLFLNVFAVRIYGEAEFFFASIKIIVIIGLLILSLCINLGGTPKYDRVGFRYYKNPGAIKELAHTIRATGDFLGFFKCLVTAAFTFGGIETVAVATGEAENPRKKYSQGSTPHLLAYSYLLSLRRIGDWCYGAYIDANLPSIQKPGAPELLDLLG